MSERVEMHAIFSFGLDGVHFLSESPASLIPDRQKPTASYVENPHEKEHQKTMDTVELSRLHDQITFKSPNWKVSISILNALSITCQLTGWQPENARTNDHTATAHFLDLVSEQGDRIMNTLRTASPPDGTYRRTSFRTSGHNTICGHHREVVIESCQAHETCHRWLSLRVEISGRNSQPDFTYNLPFDPRPLMERLENVVRNQLQAIPGVRLAKPARPRHSKFGTGSRWFIHRSPHFQLMDLLGHPNARPPTTHQQQALRASSNWKMTTSNIAADICEGSYRCEHKLEDIPLANPADQGCGPIWKKHSQALLKAFTDANPTVMFRTAPLKCVGEIQPYHHCPTKIHEAMTGMPLDHAQLCRFTDGQRFIISQPYLDDSECNDMMRTSIWRAQIPELRWLTIGTKLSWYFPNNTNLMLLGNFETLNTLNLQYPTPITGSPTGCVRYFEPTKARQPQTHTQ